MQLLINITILLQDIYLLFSYKHRIRYYKQEESNTIEDIKHPSVRECAKYLKIKDGIEIISQWRCTGTISLGSSSSFTVGMLKALHALNNHMPTKRDLALQAIKIEQEFLKESVGSQDQIASSFGGINTISFNKNTTFEVDPIILSEERNKELQDNLLL